MRELRTLKSILPIEMNGSSINAFEINIVIDITYCIQAASFLEKCSEIETIPKPHLIVVLLEEVELLLEAVQVPSQHRYDLLVVGLGSSQGLAIALY